MGDSALFQGVSGVGMALTREDRCRCHERGGVLGPRGWGKSWSVSPGCRLSGGARTGVCAAVFSRCSKDGLDDGRVVDAGDHPDGTAAVLAGPDVDVEAL